MTWNTTDQPLQGLNQFNNGELSSLSSSILKPLPTGGVAGITFSTQYQTLTNPPGGFTLINPAYSPALQFQFEQPLLQGFGVEINQLRQQHPNSVLTPFASTVRSEGILITRVKYDQTRVDFERNVAVMLLNVETAYWNLYDSYWSLYSREQGMRQAYEAYKINRLRYEAGKIPTQDLAQSTGQYESFRSQRVAALGAVLDAERQLRGLLNLPPEDGTRLIPIDPPTLTPYKPDWTTAVNEAMSLRWELILARNDLKLRQLDLIAQKNLLLPDLRFTSTYGLAGIGSRLDGGDNNAFRSLASNDFQSWSLGLRLSMPIGYRDAHAQERIARLNLTRSYYVVEEQELRCQRALQLHYRKIDENYRQIEIQRSVRQARAVELEARTKEYLAGRGTLDFLLQAQSEWADALRAEYDAIVQYNNSLAAFEFDKGTMLRYDNVTVGEGTLPAAAQVRAVEHEKERSHALLLRQRETPVTTLPASGVPNPTGIEAVPISTTQDEKPIPELNSPFTRDQKFSPSSPMGSNPSTMSSPMGSSASPLSLPASSSSSGLSLPASAVSSVQSSAGSPYASTLPSTSSPYAPAVPPAAPAGSSGFLTPASPPAMGFVPGGSVKLP